MISAFIIAMIVIVMVGTAAYTSVALMKNLENFNQVQRNTVRMDMLVGQITSALRAVNMDGVAYAPMGDVSGGRTVAPSWISEDAATPWGVKYTYCPYAPEGGLLAGTAGTVNSSTGGAYQVNLRPWLSFGGTSRSYVVGGDLPPVTALGKNVVGLIISPPPGSSDVPDCSAVTFADGAFRVTGGIVAAVRSRIAQDTTLVAMADAVRYVAPGPTGTATGLDPDNRMSMADALSLWRATKPKALTLYLDSGSYALSAAAADLGTSMGPDPSKMLNIIGAGKASTAISASAGTAVLTMPVNASIEGLSFGSGVGIEAQPGTHVALRGVAARWVYAHNADIEVADGTTLQRDSGLDSYAARVTGGKLVLRGNIHIAVDAGSEGAVAATGGDVVADGASVSVSGLAPGLTAFNLVGGARMLAVPRWIGGVQTFPVLSVNGGAGQTINGAVNADTEEVLQTCSGYSCTAICPTDKKVVAGECRLGSTGYALSRFGASVDKTSWTCDWFQSVPTDTAGPASATAVAQCSGAAH